MGLSFRYTLQLEPLQLHVALQVLDGAVGSGPRSAAMTVATTAPSANLHLHAPQEAATLQVLINYLILFKGCPGLGANLGSFGFHLFSVSKQRLRLLGYCTNLI